MATADETMGSEPAQPATDEIDRSRFGFLSSGIWV